MTEVDQNNPLGIFEGCYAKLRNGEIVGPFCYVDKDKSIIRDLGKGSRTWWRDGFYLGSSTPHIFDIIRVIDPTPANESGPDVSAAQSDEGGQSATLLRTLDKIHPATRAFLDLLHSGAPLRAVEQVTAGTIVAEYGYPGNIVKRISVSIGVEDFPLWKESVGA